MASNTKSKLAKRGKNKQSKHHLRQVGLGLLVAKDKRLPLFCSIYPGNLHDSRHFAMVIDKMVGAAKRFCETSAKITIVIDKGMNSPKNFAFIDEYPKVHFITTYSANYAKDLINQSLDSLEALDTEKNRQLPLDDQIMVYRTTGEYWGREREVIVTLNPKTARKQAYMLESKITTIGQELVVMRQKVIDKETHWQDSQKILKRYLNLCARLYMPSDLYKLEFTHTTSGLAMSFQKDVAKITSKKALFGKNIIITDNADWTTAEIVQASLDRWQVEDRFRLSKDNDLVAVRPLRHWTDGKIGCHLFSCVVAMTYLRLIELKLKSAGVNRTAKNVMDDMRQLHSVLFLNSGKKPDRRLETPTKTQSQILSVFGYHIDESGVLHKKDLS